MSKSATIVPFRAKPPSRREDSFGAEMSAFARQRLDLVAPVIATAAAIMATSASEFRRRVHDIGPVPKDMVDELRWSAEGLRRYVGILEDAIHRAETETGLKP
jgi:hypothetical protein